jgi:hypothetical protein
MSLSISTQLQTKCTRARRYVLKLPTQKEKKGVLAEKHEFFIESWTLASTPTMTYDLQTTTTRTR